MVLVAGAAAHAGMGCSAADGPADVEPVGRAASGATTCITLQRGTYGAVEDASIAAGITLPGWNVNRLLVGYDKAALLRFDVTEIPPDACVTSAALTLRTTTTFSNQPLAIDLAAAPWSEGTVTWGAFGLQIGKRVGTMIPSAADTAFTLDVPTKRVQGWAANQASNDGMILDVATIKPPSSNPMDTAFESSESPVVAYRPALQVCYTTAFCQNGGVCQNTGAGCVCACPPGFTGTQCEIDIDDCTPNPCLNGGACTDGVNSYTCQCPVGFTGADCEIDIDDCTPNPCQNGGACTDAVNGYTCQCPPGFMGADCEISNAPAQPQIVSSATYAPSDGLAYATITVTPRDASGQPLGTGLYVEVLSNDSLVTLGGTGTAACTVNAPSSTCLTAVDSGAGSYVITAKSSTIQSTPTVFFATVTGPGGTTTTPDTADVTFDSTKFQGGAGCAGACGTTITSGAVTLTGNHAGGRNLYITGGTVTFDATTVAQTLGDVFITGGTVTHLKGTSTAMYRIDVAVNSWNFLGGTVDLVQKGYGKTCFTDGSCASGNGAFSFGANGAPSSSLAAQTNATIDRYGGSHGGMGSGNYRENFSNAPNTHWGHAGPTYDDYRDPRYPGGTNSSYSAFHGGGVERVVSTKTCVLAGSATVNATSPYNGAGGTINLRCGGITSTGWTGTLNADGGQGSGSSLPVGAGGGGRIALVSTGDGATITGAVSYPPSSITPRVHAYGGAPGFLSSQHTVAAGGAGTIYIKHSGLSYGDLIVANNAPTHYPNEGTTRLPSIAGTVSASVAAGASSIPVTIASTMYNRTYYDNSGAPSVTSPPITTQLQTASTSSAYNGVFNGVWLRPDVAANGGSLFDPTNLVQVTANTTGSLATTAVPTAVPSGAVLRSIDILDHLDVTGHALLETSGDVYVISGNVANHGAPTMTLSGLALFDAASGHRGRIEYAGGLVNVVQSNLTTPPIAGGTLVADDVTFTASTVQVPGIDASNGVTLTSGTLTTNAISAASYTQAAGTLKHYPPVFKTASPAAAIVYALTMNISGNFALQGGTIDASGLGYPLGTLPDGSPNIAWGFGANGPLAATGVSFGLGAGHGAVGGGYTAGNVRGMAYDDYRDPRFPGGAAATTGGSPAYLSWRSNGGGVVRIIAGGTCTLASSTTVKASAVINASQNFGAAGGSVSMNCGGFDSTGWTGSINVNGAAAYTQSSLGHTHAGAGGRVALISTGNASSFVGSLTYPLPTSSALVQARGGAGISTTYTDGGAGTIFLQHSGVAYGQLLIGNNNQTHYASGGTTRLVSIAGTINGSFAPGSTAVGVTITSSPLHGTASFNGLLGGMWLRPDTSVNNGSLLAGDLVLVSGNTFVSSTLTTLATTPTLAALASGAAFRSIDILDKYDVVGGAVVATNGDIYVLP